MQEPNLLLIGLRGAGKSTIGRALAAAENRPFLDLDDATAAFLHCDSVADAWARCGETEFRRAESQALSAALNDQGRIIALGGGTPTAPGAADRIEAASHDGRAVVVYLRCDPAELRARLGRLGAEAMANRPSLTGAGAMREIEVIFDQRDALYQRLAARTVEGINSVDDAMRALSNWRSWRR